MQQTTVADLIAILSQLDASLVTTLPPGIQAPAAQPADAPAAAAQPADAPAAAAQPANAPAAAAQPADAPAAAAQPANAPAAAAQPANVPAAAAQPANAPAQPASATATANPLAVFAAMFRCPNCDTVHFLSPINGPPPIIPPVVPRVVPSAPPASQAATSAGAAGVAPYVPPFGAYLFGPSASQFSAPPSTPSSRSIAPASTPGCADPGSVPPTTSSMPSGRWYSVTYGRQIGVFQDWFGVVEPLVSGVPGWKCKSFCTLAAATAHFNAHVAAGQTGIYVDN